MNSSWSSEHVKYAAASPIKGQISADMIEAAEQLKGAAERFLLVAKPAGGLEV